MKNKMNTLLILSLLLIIGACAKGSGEDNDVDGIENQMFTKNVLIMEFVSIDCVYCPRVHQQLEEASADDYPGRIDVISVHGRLKEDDPMEFSRYKQFQNYFYAITGYPAVILDQRDDLVTIGNFDASASAFQNLINAKSPLGIALRTTIVDDNTVRIDVEIVNKGKANSDYSLAVAVLENGILYKQANLVDGSLQWIPDYTHDRVLRAILSENYFGDPIESLEKDDTYAKSFSYTIPSTYKKENLSFVAYVVEASGFAKRGAVNSRSVTIGKSIGFEEETN